MRDCMSVYTFVSWRRMDEAGDGCVLKRVHVFDAVPGGTVFELTCIGAFPLAATMKVHFRHLGLALNFEKYSRWGL